MSICDINPDHGEMQIEPMYGKAGEVLQYGYFCPVPDCDGYGGPAKKQAPAKKVKRDDEAEQLSFA